MFRTNDKIMTAFARQERERFIHEMKQHFRQLYPESFPADERVMEDFILKGIEKAKSYSISSEADVCRFLSVMLELGQDFDTDPELPWAAQILCGPGTQKARNLVDSTRHYLNIYSTS
jgi:hypothetical protein